MNFKRYVESSDTWADTPHYVHKTSTDTITTLPAVLYLNDTTATVGLKGNTVQNGTPTPQNPVMPEGCGDLETTGEHTGQYKIPISSANTTTPIYLGEVETTRIIRKLVFNGTEPWVLGGNIVYINNTDTMKLSPIICTHFPNVQNTGMWNGNNWVFQVDISNLGMSGRDAWTTYLQQQYAAGTPVTVWYVLAEPETAVVNEPLMKIGEYADEVSGITIPTIAGANTISVDTTLQPSEVTVNYKGWHPVQSVHERDNDQWD